MGKVELILIAVGLAMDAFAVAVCKGLNMKKFNALHAFIIALFFGVFQGVMPLIGWGIGISFKGYIESLDHWVAFIMLAVIGVKMIYETFTEEECAECKKTSILDIKELVVLSVATSIDALAVGISFSLFPEINIIFSASIIAIITLVVSFAGAAIGNKFGSKYEKKAAIAGGVILNLIGLKILFEHLLG